MLIFKENGNFSYFKDHLYMAHQNWPVSSHRGKMNGQTLLERKFYSVPIKMLIVWVGKYRAGLSEDLGFASLMTQKFSKHGCPRWGRGRAWIIEIPKRIIFILVQVPTSLDTRHKTGCLHLCLQAAFSPRSPPPDPQGGMQAARVHLPPWASCRGPRLPQEWPNCHPLAWLRPCLLCFIAEAHSASPVGPGSL